MKPIAVAPASQSAATSVRQRVISECRSVETIRCGERNNRRLGRPFKSGKSKVIFTGTAQIMAFQREWHKAATKAYNPPPFFGILSPVTHQLSTYRGVAM